MHVMILKTTLFVLLLSSNAFGHNTYFLPGDAFFFSRLDSKGLQRMQTSESPILQYGLPSNGAMGCGYIGYEKIQLQEMDIKTKLALVESFRLFEKELKAGLELDKKAHSGGFVSEAPPEPEINIFIYSTDYDWKQNGIAIQYNENWLDESIAFGTKREHTRLNVFSSASVTKNWRDANLIESLSAECPGLPDGNGKDFPTAYEKPIRKLSSKCRFLIIPNRSFNTYAPQPEDGVKLVEVFEGKITQLVRKNGEWKTISDGE